MKTKLNFKLSLDIFRDKRVRYGGYAALVTLGAVVVLVAVNLIVQQLPAEIDMTENKLFTLSDQTYDILGTLEEDVIVYGLYRTGSENDNVVDVLRKYERASKMVMYEQIDPDKSPAFLQRYDEEGKGLSAGTLIIESGEIFKVIPSIDLYDVSYNQQGQGQVMGFKVEQRVTSALLYVTSGETPKIRVLEGHGEYSLISLGLLTTIERENFEVETINLVKQPDIPEDVDMLLVLSPDFDISEGEAEVILGYLENGGSGLFFFDLNDEEMPNFGSLLESFGVAVTKGVVMEGDRDFLYSAENPFFLVPEMAGHDITTPLDLADLSVLMPYSMSVETLDVRKRNLEIEPLFQTSKSSWLRTDLEDRSLQRQTGDTTGPLDLAVAIYKRKTEMDEPEGFRLIVSGNASFLSNIPYFGTLKPNIDFFLNSISWLNKRTDSISIRSKSLFTFPLRISGTMQLIYAAIFVILIPVGLLLAGLVVWLRRRHL